MKKNIREFSFKHDLSEKDYFIHACFVNDLQVFYKDWIEQKTGRIQFFDSMNNILIHKYWKPSNICCESGEILNKENIDVKISYWTPFIWKPIRKDLKQQAMKYEAFECQKIDASCNDCKYLDRMKSWCNNLEKEIIINENLCHVQNQQCFIHRKEITLK